MEVLSYFISLAAVGVRCRSLSLRSHNFSEPQMLMKRNNFNSGNAVYAGLVAADITRLKETWNEALQRGSNAEEWDAINFAFDLTQNCKSYRLRAAQCQQDGEPWIAYLGV